VSAAQLVIAAATLGLLGFPVPAPDYPVRDDAGILDAAARQAVVEACAALQRETDAEIGVLTLDSTDGEPHAAFALRVFNSWGVGKAGADNGVLLLFALGDRRVELVPGDGYQDLFDAAASSALLQRVVVPRMRAGEPGAAVVDAVLEVAAQVRQHEGVGGATAEAPADAPARAVEAGFGGGGRTAAPVAAVNEEPAGPQQLATRVALGGLLAGLVLLLGVVVVRSYRTGRLLLPVPALWGLLVLGLLALAGLWGALVAEAGLAEAVAGGGGVTSGFVLGAMIRRICPACRRRLTITSRTLQSATTSRSGAGERTYRCPHCGLHRVETYTIARIQESSSSNSSSSSYSSSSSGGSFGGGSSSGGGGGASW
jgi:uncharacterized protein